MRALVCVYIIEEVAHNHAQNAPIIKNWPMNFVQAAGWSASCIFGDRHSWINIVNCQCAA